MGIDNPGVSHAQLDQVLGTQREIQFRSRDGGNFDAATAFDLKCVFDLGKQDHLVSYSHKTISTSST